MNWDAFFLGWGHILIFCWSALIFSSMFLLLKLAKKMNWAIQLLYFFYLLCWLIGGCFVGVKIYNASFQLKPLLGSHIVAFRVSPFLITFCMTSCLMILSIKALFYKSLLKIEKKFQDQQKEH